MNMNVTLLNPACSDGDVVEYVCTHYFTTDELADAQRMMDEGTRYEEVVATLTERCQYPLLRRSDDEQTHMLITLPNGRVMAWHPERRYPDFQPVLVCSVSDLARRAFPRPPTMAPSTTRAAQPVTVRYEIFSLFDDVPDIQGQGTQVETKTARPPITRPKKLTFLEQPIHVGTKNLWSSQVGWVVKHGHLGYGVALPSGVERNHTSPCTGVGRRGEPAH